MKVAAFTRYGSRAASTRQRLLQYLPALEAAGMEVELHPLLDDAYVQAIAEGGKSSRAATARSYLHRVWQAQQAVRTADLIWIYAELFPYLPAMAERIVFRRGVPVVYDFDDAFFLAYDNSNPLVRSVLRDKHAPLLSRAAAIFCGNDYLCDFARRYSTNAIYLPTVVDTETYSPRPRSTQGPVVIGWIGSPSTWRYVLPIVPVLKRLADSLGITIRVVGAGNRADTEVLGLPRLNNLEWELDREITDIQEMDIGIMPTVDEPWALGKCGYKLIQYMACGLPVVATPIGVANRIVDHGVNGFLAGSDSEWSEFLSRLVADATLRKAMGEAGRAKVVSEYSLQAHEPRFVHHLQELVGQSR